MYRCHRSGILLFDALCAVLLALIGITACLRVVMVCVVQLDVINNWLGTLNEVVRLSHMPGSDVRSANIEHQILSFSPAHASVGPYYLPAHATIQIKTISSVEPQGVSLTTASVTL